MAGNSTAPKRTTDHTSESRTNSKRPRPTSTPTQFHTGNSTHSSHHLNSTSTRGSSSLNRTSSATNLPQVVINSTTYDVGYGSETITRASGSPIVLESGGIVVGSSSVPFPSSTASSTDQASKGITIGGVPITVETPSPTHFEKPAAVTDVIINGETYLLPQSRVELPREDGSTLVLEPSAVVIDSQTFPVPPVSESTSLTASGSAGPSGSNTIVAQPGPTKKPSTGGLLGFAGLLHALGGIASDAREASSSINKVMDEGAKWAAGNMENGDSGFASAVDDALNTGTARLRSTRSSLSGLGENLGTELDSLTPGGKRVFQGVDKSCSGTFDWLQTVGDLVKRLPKLVGKNRKIVDNTLRLIFKNAKNHPLVTGNMALAAFEVYQWSKEPKDGPVPPAQSATTATSTNTTESATKTRSSSTSTTTTSDPTRIPYIISAKWDAPPGKFQDFVKTLPEPGSHTAEDGLLNHGEPFWDLYFTKLSRKEAAEVRQHDFIETAISGYETNVNFQKFNVLTNMDKPSNRSLDKRSNNPTPDQNLYTRLPHYSHLQLISQPTKDHPPGNNPYLFDPSLGYQSSIYVLDGGCDRNHKELQVGERGGGPDSVTGWPENEWFHDIDGHGTMVSSVAAGIDLGVASKANIICVQAFLSTQPPTPEQRQLFLQRMRQAFSWTRTEIDRKRNWNSAVINLSGGETLRRDRNTGQVIPEDVPLNEYYQEMLRWCDARGVPFVLAAGNYGNAWYDGTSAVGQFGSADPPPPNTVPYTMQWLTPQSISQSYRSVITVGGVNNNGSLWPYTTPYISRQRQFGYIDTYAQADSVTVALAGTQDTRPIPGTSFATGAVSGLVAYFLGIGRIRQGWLVPSNLPQGQGPQQILDLRAIKSSLSQPAPLSTQKYAYERTSYPFVNFNPQNLNYHALGGFPDILPVVYNDAWTGWCERGRPLPPPRMIKRLKGRANPSPQDSGDQPVVVNGQVVATDVINLYSCPVSSSLPGSAGGLSGSASSTSSSSTGSLPGSTSSVPSGSSGSLTGSTSSTPPESTGRRTSGSSLSFPSATSATPTSSTLSTSTRSPSPTTSDGPTYCQPFQDPDKGNPGYCQCTDGAHFSFASGNNPCPYTSPGPSGQSIAPTSEPMPSTMPDPTTSSSFTFTLAASCSSHVPMQSQNPYAPVSDDCDSGGGGSHSDIFTCGDNSTLFDMFAPGGTPHSNGQASNDIGGWETFAGGGCACINGAFCCNPRASTCLPIEQTDDDWQPGANEVTWFATLKPACSCDG